MLPTYQHSWEPVLGPFDPIDRTVLLEGQGIYRIQILRAGINCEDVVGDMIEYYCSACFENPNLAIDCDSCEYFLDIKSPTGTPNAVKISPLPNNQLVDLEAISSLKKICAGDTITVQRLTHHSEFGPIGKNETIASMVAGDSLISLEVRLGVSTEIIPLAPTAAFTSPVFFDSTHLTFIDNDSYHLFSNALTIAIYNGLLNKGWAHLADFEVLQTGDTVEIRFYGFNRSESVLIEDGSWFMPETKIDIDYSNINGCIDYTESFAFTFNPSNFVTQETLASSLVPTGPPQIFQCQTCIAYIPNAPRGVDMKWVMSGSTDTLNYDTIVILNDSTPFVVDLLYPGGCLYQLENPEGLNARPHSETVVRHKTDEVLHLYPVPTTEQLVVSLDSDTASGNGKMVIYDANGRVIRQLSVDIIRGHNQYTVDVARCAAGMYVLEIVQEKSRLNKRFIVID